MQGTCATCRYRDPDNRPDYSDCGHCKRFPPILVETVAFDGSGLNHYSQQQPWMHGTDWCGEYQPKDQPQ